MARVRQQGTAKRLWMQQRSSGSGNSCDSCRRSVTRSGEATGRGVVVMGVRRWWRDVSKDRVAHQQLFDTDVSYILLTLKVKEKVDSLEKAVAMEKEAAM